MKYFLDTEFLEGPQKKTFLGIPIGYTKPTIDLISIGIVAEDRREYYAISKDFNLKEAWNRFDLKIDDDNFGLYTKRVYWIRENVLRPIFEELFEKSINDGSFIMNHFYTYQGEFSFGHLRALIDFYGLNNKDIAEEVKQFCTDEVHVSVHKGKLIGAIDPVRGNPEFYAYFADYDWVVFCWLFGKMMDLPSGFPMYCKDLKQILDDKAMSLLDTDIVSFDIKHQDFEAVKSNNYSDYLSAIKNHSNYPKQDPSKSHNAIEDARWNKQLYDFLNKL